MIQIWELETKSGRIFRVVVANKSQKKRLLKVISDNKNKSYDEVFIRIENTTSGIYDIKQFEQIAGNLV